MQYHKDNHYFIDAENGTETARLELQDTLLHTLLGGLVPATLDLSERHDLLDLACGPGAWVLEMAFLYPEKTWVGVDVSPTLVHYAQAQARVQQVGNAHFQQMDLLTTLAFADASFDLVHLRFLTSFMPKAAWPALLSECHRILRPGGLLWWSEVEFPHNSSPALTRLYRCLGQALIKAGQSLSVDGASLGIFAWMGPWLRQAGFQVSLSADPLETSAGTGTAYQLGFQDHLLLFEQVQPFLVQHGVLSQAEGQALCVQAAEEMMDPDFACLSVLLTAWAHKPLT